MKIRCVWEHNRQDSLLWAVDDPGVFTRGKTKEEAVLKMGREVRAYRNWACLPQIEVEGVEIVQESECELAICDADSDVIFDAELGGMTRAEYEALKALCLRSAADFERFYVSIPDKDAFDRPARATFYGEVPRTAAQMYDHTKNVTAYYFDQIGVEADNEGDILSCRERGFAALERMEGFLEMGECEGSFGEIWSLRKVLRRFLWHDRIHARAMCRLARRIWGKGILVEPFGFLD